MKCPFCSAIFDAELIENGETLICADCGAACEVHDDFALDLTTGEKRPVLFLEIT